MAQAELIAGLDMGTRKMTCLIGQVDEAGKVTVMGVGTGPSAGMRKGVVVDIEGAARAAQRVVQNAQRMAGVQVRSLYLAVTGGRITSVNNRGMVAVARADREITREDVSRVMEAARVINVPPDFEIIHALPRQFVVDGYDGVTDPVGMVGVRLEVEAHIVMGLVTSLENVMRSVYKAGLEVEGLVLAPLAAGEAVLQPAERELGVVLVDVGGGTTDVALFDQGSIYFASILPVGGDHVTSDIAVGLRTPLDVAERLKKEYGCARREQASGEVTFEVTSVGGSSQKQVDQRTLAGIVEPRVQEIFSLVGDELAKARYNRTIPGGVVLTGGMAELEGIVELAEQVLDMPVRLGIPQGVSGLTDMVRSPAYATAVGLLIYGAKDRALAALTKGQGGLMGSLWERLRALFRDLF